MVLGHPCASFTYVQLLLSSFLLFYKSYSVLRFSVSRFPFLWVLVLEQIRIPLISNLVDGSPSLPTYTMLHLLPLLLLSSLALASPISPQAANAGAASNSPSSDGKPASEGTTTFDGQALSKIPAAPAAEEVMASDASISQAGWTVTADSAQDGNPPQNAIDGDNTTIWHTEYSPDLAALPHTFTINMGSSYLVGSISYNPRQDGGGNGNIGEHIIQTR